MLDLVTTLGYYIRDYSRFFLGSTALALALLLAGLLAFAPGASRTGDVQSLGQLHRAGANVGLADNRIAHVAIAGVVKRAPVGRIVPPQPRANEPRDPGRDPVAQPIAAVIPAVTGGPSPASSPPLLPTPEPSKPTPQPNPNPQPDPVPPPAPEAPFVLLSPPSPEPTQPDNGQVLFRATFDANFKGWYVQSLPGRTSLNPSDPFEGNRAARFEVRPGDVEPDTGSQRAEISGPTFDEGEDLFIRDAIRVPGSNTYSAPWQLVQQLHDIEGSPGMAVFLDNQPSLKIGAGDSSPMYWQGPKLEPDRWYDLVYRVYLSQDPSKGFVEVWLDGVHQTLLNGQARMHGRTIQAPQMYIKAGIYRSSSSTGISIVEHDQIVIGTSLVAVTAD